MDLLRRWEEEHQHLEKTRQRIDIWRRTEAYVDAGRGACWLRRQDVAECFMSHLYKNNGVNMDLKAWVIMPNHVHLLVGIPDGGSLPQLMKTLKGASARDVNMLLGRRGTFWYREYFDRFIHDEAHYNNTLRYIENNPVKAQLAPRPEAWPFSSAGAHALVLAD